MNVSPIRTEIYQPGSGTLIEFLGSSLREVSEGSVLAISSKLVSLTEGSFVDAVGADKQALIEREADLFYHPSPARPFALTITKHMLIPDAGIDPTGKWLVTWPNNPQATANQVREWLVDTFDITQVGVVITDTTTRPLQRGTTGVALAHSGFAALKDYRGQHDVYKRVFEPTWANHAQALAAAAVVCMGEADEQTPLAVISDIPFVTFQDRNPIDKELAELHVSKNRDVYAPLLNSIDWQQRDRD